VLSHNSPVIYVWFSPRSVFSYYSDKCIEMGGFDQGGFVLGGFSTGGFCPRGGLSYTLTSVFKLGGFDRGRFRPGGGGVCPTFIWL